jgi:alpha-amylase
LLVFVSACVSFAQGGYNDGRVLIQGFMWESSVDGKPAPAWSDYEVHWKNRWYDEVKNKAGELADAKFDVIWLPPPSNGEGAGYHPHALYNFNNNYGDEASQKAALKALLEKGIEPIADVVINHRTGTRDWSTFTNPTWPANFICADDEFWWADDDSRSSNDRATQTANDRGGPDYTGSDFTRWNGSRDLDHSNPEVRKEVKKYLKALQKLGYRGWRYDLVKGYAPSFTAEYDFDSQPTFAVGEFMDGNAQKVSDWIDGTKQIGQADPALKACPAFDFPGFYLLRDLINNEKYSFLPALHLKDGSDDALIALNKDKAVTFTENHDTGFPQKQFDSFGNNAKLMQAYAYILTHPGIPCVYWKHYFDWNRGDEIKKLIKARKYAGVHSGSYIKSEVHGNNYVAIVGDQPGESSTLIVKIGPGTGFSPDSAVWDLETYGNGYAVWVRKSKKAETKAAVDKPKDAFPVP